MKNFITTTLVLIALASTATADGGSGLGGGFGDMGGGMGIAIPQFTFPDLDGINAADPAAMNAWGKCLLSLGTNCAEWKEYLAAK